MRKGTKERANAKRLRVSARDEVVVGLDVHKQKTFASIRVNGREVKSCSMPSAADAVVRGLEPYRAGLRTVVYEAGPTGYGLARALHRAGMPVEVVAPGETPRSATHKSKSDRLDCRKLALLAEKRELLQPVAVPTAQEEDDRQVIRLREQLMDKRRRVKQQIKSFLLYHGLEEPHGLAYWSIASVEALRVMELRAALRLYLDVVLEEFDALAGLLKRVNAEVKRLAQQQRHAEAMRRLQSHPGIGRVTAITFLVEVYRPERFASDRQLAKYVGLAPLVRESGETRRGGPLIKAGRGRLRAMLVEAAWTWIRQDAHARAVYNRLVCNTGSTQKAIVGMARRLAITLWLMLVREETYRQAA